MNKKAIFILILVIFLVIFYIGFTMDKNDKQNEIIKNDMTFEKENKIIQNNETIETTAQEEKITPNTILILKKHYTDCGHIITDKTEMPEEMVNLSEEEIKKRYPNWKIEKFSQNEVILTKELESFCGEHYYITEENGYISIYTVDEADNKKLKETGKISCEYLPETDRINLRNGIMLYGTQELNKMLEDYE